MTVPVIIVPRLDVLVEARARAFTGERAKEHRFLVSLDGTVRVHDPIAGYYTTCHSLSDGAIRRIRRLASDGGTP